MTTAHTFDEGPQGWSPLSHRHGYASVEDAERWDDARWRTRHNPDIVEGREPDELKRCNCPGNPGGGLDGPCAVTGGDYDHLCEACRAYCWALHPSGSYLRLRKVYGTAKMSSS